MSISLSNVAGSFQTGFTSPVYNVVSDSAPDNMSKQWYVGSLGGTQTGVTTHSVSKPFTVTFKRPTTLKVLGNPNPSTGAYSAAGTNTFTVLTRKGADAAANLSYTNGILIRTTIETKAGVETYSPSELRAALSCHVGALNQVSPALGDSCITGAL